MSSIVEGSGRAREWSALTSDELEAVDRRTPVVWPLGLVESHGPVLTLGFDNESADYFARQACGRVPSLLLPQLSYGFADEFRDYPGTVGLTMDTLGHVIADVCAHVASQGFTKIILITGHGANQDAARLGFERVWRQWPRLRLACWSWWSVVDLPIHHADEVETSFAMAIGARTYLERARDTTFQKPWHAVRSRHEFQPASGGVNGAPSTADPATVAAVHDQIVDALAARIQRAHDDATQN